MKFREKPIEAFQYTGVDSLKNDKGEWLIPKWAVTALFYGILYQTIADELWLKKIKNDKASFDEEFVNFGDYVMQKPNGEIVAISEEDFLKNYEQVSDDGEFL